MADDHLCSETTTTEPPPNYEPSFFSTPNGQLTREARIERAWSHWKKLGEPRLIVAPMVDNSELPFRILCRRHGAEAAYTPMLHSRIFSENENYRSQEFTTCKCYKELKKGMYGDLGDPLVGSNKWPINPPKFKKLMEDYLILCTELSRKIMRGIALAHGGSVDEFEGKIAGDPFWMFRIIGYPGASSTSDEGLQKNDVGCGAHTDYGLLTLVNQDDDKTPLEVRNVSGKWVSAVPIPGTFVCNMGNMLKILTNGLYEPTLHRVINNSPIYRVSVAFFYEPNFNVAISPLDVCIKKSGESKKFEPVVFGEHLVSKVLTSFKY